MERRYPAPGAHSDRNDGPHCITQSTRMRSRNWGATRRPRAKRRWCGGTSCAGAPNGTSGRSACSGLGTTWPCCRNSSTWLRSRPPGHADGLAHARAQRARAWELWRRDPARAVLGRAGPAGAGARPARTGARGFRRRPSDAPGTRRRGAASPRRASDCELGATVTPRAPRRPLLRR